MEGGQTVRIGEQEYSLTFTTKETQVEEQRVLYALTNVDKTIGDVEFPADWGEGWSWESPHISLVANGAYGENSYYFTALYTDENGYPIKVKVQVYIGTIAGVWVEEKGNSHNHILETGGEDSLTLTLGVTTQGKVRTEDYQLGLGVTPAGKAENLTITEKEKGVYTVTAEKAGKYTLKPEVMVGESTLSLKKKAVTSYTLNAVANKQAAAITVTSDTEGVTVSGNTLNGNTRSTISIHTEGKKVGQSFTLKAEVLDRLGEPLNTKLEWKSSDKSVATIKTVRGDNHSAIVTIRGEGHSLITVKAKDKLGRQTQLDVEIRNYEPRVSTHKATVNLAYDYSAETGKQLAAAAGQVEILPAYGESISSVQLLQKGSEEKEPNFKLEQTGTYTWLVSPADYGMATGTYESTLQVTTGGGSYTYELKVDVLEKKPTVTAKMGTKLNLFYTDATADVQLKISDRARAESVTWKALTEGAGGGFSLEKVTLVKTGKEADYVRVSQQNGLRVAEGSLADPGVAQGSLSIALTGYREPCVLDFAINWQYKKPVLVTKTASTNVMPELEQNQNYFTIYNKTEKQELSYQEGTGSSRNQVKSVLGDTDKVALSLSQGSSRIGYTYTGEAGSQKLTLTLASDCWREDLQASHTIKTQKARAKLTATTLTYNSNEPSTLSTAITLANGITMDYTSIQVEGATAKARKLVEEGLLVTTASGSQVTFKPGGEEAGGEKIPKGSYKYKITPYYTNAQTGEQKALNTLTLTLKVVDKPLTAKVSPKGSLDLAKGSIYNLKTKKNCLWVDPRFTNLPGGGNALTHYQVTGYELIGEYSDYFQIGKGAVINGEKSVEHYYLTVSPEGIGKLDTRHSYKLAILYTLENAAGETLTVTSNTFKVRPRQTKPKVTVGNNNQTLYAGAEGVSRTYTLTVPEGYTIQSAAGGLDCNKDGIADIKVSGDSLLTVEISDKDAVVATAKGKTYSIPVTVNVVGRDGISKDAAVKIKVTVKR